jgi:hypothetical protein
VLTVAGTWLVGAVVLAHAIALGGRIGQALTGPLAALRGPCSAFCWTVLLAL